MIYKKLSDSHGISHFQEALKTRSNFYFDGILCYCTQVNTNDNVVKILSVNLKDKEFYPYKWINLK